MGPLGHCPTLDTGSTVTPAAADLLVPADRAGELRSAAVFGPSWTLTRRQRCDLELLMTGAFSPLGGFMTRADYQSVRSHMRLSDGRLWPIVVALEVPEDVATTVGPGGTLGLRDDEGVLLAVLHATDVWKPDGGFQAQISCVGGPIEGVELPRHYAFGRFRFAPAQAREEFARLGWDRVAAFQTSFSMSRKQRDLTLQAAGEIGAGLLIQPTLGTARVGEHDEYSRIRAYEEVLGSYPPGTARLSVINLPASGEAREMLAGAIVAKNFGCAHYMLPPDASFSEQDARTGSGVKADYSLLREHRAELGILLINLPADFAVERPVRATHFEEPRSAHATRGFTVFFTGLSGAGKSTIANILRAKLLETGDRAVTLLDGDVVRRHLSSELGFSREHRDLNIRRIGYVASEITKHGGIAICAPIAPYAHTRREVREMIEPLGGFVLVHVATSLEVCERRDRKNLYARARAGLLPHFTGISDPYEPPDDAELVIDASVSSAESAATSVLEYVKKAGFF